MSNFKIIKDYECVYLIYGSPNSGKTTIVKYLYKQLLEANPEMSTYAITSSNDLDEIAETHDEYNIESVDSWIENKKGTGLLIFDDFMHINLNHQNKISLHIKKLLSTTRKPNIKLNIIFSCHFMSGLKFMRSICAVFITTKIDEDAEKLIRSKTGLALPKIRQLKKIIQSKKNKYSFLITNEDLEPSGFSIIKFDLHEIDENYDQKYY